MNEVKKIEQERLRMRGILIEILKTAKEVGVDDYADYCGDLGEADKMRLRETLTIIISDIQEYL